jgi:hypothetical protein
MSNSLEKACEDFFIALFAADPRSAGKQLANFDEDSTANSNAIVFQAKQGAKQLAADGGYDVEMIIEYRSPIGTAKSERDQGSALIHQVVYESTLTTNARAALATAAGLSCLLIKDESTGDRQNSSDLRKKIVTLPLQAKLA